jgi:hypothetical protein
MNISKIYLREIYLKKFCEEIDDSIQLSEEMSLTPLSGLLKSAEEIIFPRFGINPTDKNKYFIAGSARLHLYPQLSQILNDKVGDLDIIIPGEKEWKYLENYLNSNNIDFNKDEVKRGIYRPKENSDIEAFKIWNPSLIDPKKFKDVKFTPTDELLRTSNRKSVLGYYFMSLYDVVDYKLKLNRDKEKAVTSLLFQYIEATTESVKNEVKEKLLNMFVGDEDAAKSFLAPSLSSQLRKK